MRRALPDAPGRPSAPPRNGARRACAFACLLALLLAAEARSQEAAAPPSQPTFRSGVGLVRVDVTVTDREGRPVADLGPDDFELKEDGVSQAIQLLQFQRLTGRVADGDDRSLTIRSPDHAAQEAARDDVRLLVIFIDDYHLRYGTLFDHRLREMLRRFIDEELRPTDLMAVMGPLTPLSDLGLTRDKRALFDRIDRVQGHLGGFVPPRSPLEEAQLRLAGSQLSRIRTQVTLSALEALVVHLGGLREGRTSVLFVSHGPSMQAGGLSMFDRLRDIIAAANRSNVTIHTLDPRELGMSRPAETLNASLAAETGGRELRESNDHSRGLKAVMGDASAYYLLGYTPTRVAADGRFHEISVKVRRKGVRVLARKGYWAPAPAELTRDAAPPPPQEVVAAVARLARLERSGRITGWVGASPVNGYRAGLLVACEVEDPDLPPAIAEVAAALSGDQPLAVSLTPHGAGRTLWVGELDAPAGTYRVTVTARDGTGDLVEQWAGEVHVAAPGDTRSRLGTPRVYRPGTVKRYRGFMAGEEIPPTPERRFRRSDRVIVRLPIAGDAATPVTAELANTRGETLTALPVSRAAGGMPQVELPLGSLAQAEYVLTLTVAFDQEPASERVAFAVVP